MITANKSHKTAKLEKIVNLGKATVAVTVAGAIVTIGVFAHSAFTKKDIKVESIHGFSHSAELSGYEVLDDKLEEELKKNVLADYRMSIEHYLENKKEPISVATEDGEALELIETSYNPKLNDEDTIEISDFFKSEILFSIRKFDERNDKNYKVTVADLKEVKSLNIDVVDNVDITWLNYCDNLTSLELNIKSDFALEHLKKIQKLNITELEIQFGNWYQSHAVSINSEYFAFIKNCPNLSKLTIDSSSLTLNENYANVFNKENAILTLENFSGHSQKIDIRALEKYSSVNFMPIFGSGVYDFAIIFTREEFNALLESDTKIYVDGVELREYKDEILWTYDKIDKMMNNLNVNLNMSDEEKVENVIRFVVDKMTYNQAVIDYLNSGKSEGLINPLGPITNELTENSYKDGYLYGALNPNGKPVCGNYAALTDVLLNNLQVETYFIVSKQHAYNLINVDNEYYYIDTTWLDVEYIDLDEIFENRQHLIDPVIAPVESIHYETQIFPANIKFPQLTEMTAIEKTDEIFNNIKDKYKVKINNQFITMSISSLVAILSGLGLAISTKKYKRAKKIDNEIIGKFLNKGLSQEELKKQLSYYEKYLESSKKIKSFSPDRYQQAIDILQSEINKGR